MFNTATNIITWEIQDIGSEDFKMLNYELAAPQTAGDYAIHTTIGCTDENETVYPAINISKFIIVSGAALPDLTLTSGDIRFIPPSPNSTSSLMHAATGDLTLATAPVTEISALKATIHNIGTVDASDVTVQFFDGDPGAGGIQIGSDQTITSIPAGGAGMVSVDWTPGAYAYAIYVRVDPFDSIQESNEENNIAFNTILLGTRGDLNNDGTITPADAMITLQIAAGSHPSDPATRVAADVSGDGQVTPLDALMILQAAAGAIEL